MPTDDFDSPAPTGNEEVRLDAEMESVAKVNAVKHNFPS